MNRFVVITGHLGGVGSHLTNVFTDSGYRVVGIDREAADSRAWKQIVCDFSRLIDAESTDTLRLDILAALEAGQLVALVNNAASQQLGALAEVEIEAFAGSLQINALAPLLLTRLMMPELAQATATVINIGSIHARQTKAGFAPYSISKAALAGVTRAMAIEWGEEITVLEVQPAAIATPMLEAGFRSNQQARERLDGYHPTGQIGNPHELAQLVLDLVRSPSRFLNGAIVSFDGGISHVLHDPT